MRPGDDLTIGHAQTMSEAVHERFRKYRLAEKAKRPIVIEQQWWYSPHHLLKGEYDPGRPTKEEP